MNIDNPNGPVGIDEPEPSIGVARGAASLPEQRLRGEVYRLEEQLTRRVKNEQFLQQQVDRLVQTTAASRQDEQNRRQEILRELSTEKSRRQEAETEASLQRHRATELTFTVDALEAELQALTGCTREERKNRPQVIAPGIQTKLDLPTNSHLESADIAELQTEVALLREQVIIHRDDFDREHKEKEKLLRLNKQLQEELDRIGLEVSATKTRVNKLENENEVLLTDNRLFKDNFIKGKDCVRDAPIKKPDFYEDILLDKMSSKRGVEPDFMKERPHAVALHKPHSGTFTKPHSGTFTKPDITMTAREWTCTRCTLVNTAVCEFCDVCGHRDDRRHVTPRHMFRQQPPDRESAPVSGWTECDTYIDTSYS